MTGTLELFMEFFEFIWLSLLALAPMLLLGLLLAGLLHVFISRDAILRHFDRDNLKSVASAAAIGVPMPLCSCSVVPVVAEMRRKGASRSSCMSFLITVPETGVDSILVTNGFLGWPAAICRPIVSFITAMVAGILCIGLARDSDDTEAELVATNCCKRSSSGWTDVGASGHRPLFSDRHDCYLSPSEFATAAVLWLRSAFRRNRPVGCSAAACSPNHGFGAIIRHIIRYGFVEIADDLLFAMLVGLALGGVLYIAIPAELLTHEYSRWAAYPAMVLVALPIYICASASTPIAAALIANGLSPGAGLVFLMTGPATNVATIAVILKFFGRRFTSIYVGSVVVVSIVLGVSIDLLLLTTGYGIAVNLGPSESPAIQFVQLTIALGFIAFILWRAWEGAYMRSLKGALARFVPKHRT